MEHEKKEQSENIEKEEVIKISDIKKKLSNLFSNKSKKESKEKDEMSIDLKDVKTKFNQHKYWLIPLILLIIAITVSTHLRMMPSSLPATDDWAASTVNSHFKGIIEQQINQQYPLLTGDAKDNLISKELTKFNKENKDQIKSEINRLSEQYKGTFQDENGDTYLIAIDPYLWYAEARNVINHGHLGDKLIEGESYYSLRDGRNDKKSSIQLHPYIAAYTYKFLKIFNPDITLMRALFLLPMLLINLALIPTFFIVRKITNNIGGFFAAIFVAINGPLLGRTIAGFADTDAYNVTFPLLIAWLFLEAYTAKKQKNGIILATLAGLMAGIYAGIWTGWLGIFLFTIGSSIIASTIFYFKSNKDDKAKIIKNHGTVLLTYIVSSGIFVSIFKNTAEFFSIIRKPIGFITLKEVGIKSVWPNVLTTVAEFNTASFSNIINQMGGNLLIFLAVIGIIFSILKKKNKQRELIYVILFPIWLIATAYAFTKGMRFAILMVPPLAIGFGITAGILFEKGSNLLKKSINLNQNLSKVFILIVLLFLISTPFTTAQNTAKSQVPSMNDVWYNTLTKIKDNTTNAIITSWWDFGHWFAAISERRVTFDGGDQGEKIHWVGKLLLSEDEKTSVGVLRMLNCAQEEAPHQLDKFTKKTYKSIEILNQVFPISDRSEAKQKYVELGLSPEEAETMLEFTHCKDIIPNFLITSQDMVGKAGVWGHFGSWDFEKATMYQTTKNLPTNKAVEYLTTEFGLTNEEAQKTHLDIKNNKGDQWIAPWPGYISGSKKCDSTSGSTIVCVNSIQGQQVIMTLDLENENINLENLNDKDVKPDSIVFQKNGKIIKKDFTGKTTGFSVVIIQKEDSYYTIFTHPLLAASTFTKLFFYEGYGQSCFEKFDDVTDISSSRIITWKINFEC